MDFKTFGNIGSPSLLLIPGLGVSYEIFKPLIGLLEGQFHVIAVQVDGFTLERHTEFTSVDDQARQVAGLHCDTKVEVFKGMNHGQLLVERPEEVSDRIIRIQYEEDHTDTGID